MSQTLAQARCFTHLSREAVAKCPACGRFYCRECVTEHEGRVVCRSCLDALLEEKTVVTAGWFRGMVASSLAFGGYLLVVGVFYYLGSLLLKIPSKFHSGQFFE